MDKVYLVFWEYENENTLESNGGILQVCSTLELADAVINNFNKANQDNRHSAYMRCVSLDTPLSCS